jgi:hypothetical protein
MLAATRTVQTRPKTANKATFVAVDADVEHVVLVAEAAEAVMIATAGLA